MPLLSSNCKYNVVERSFVPSDDAPVLLEGADVYDILCPPSKLTGNRSNPLDLLKMALPDKDYRFLGQILQEVPSVSSDPNLSDEDRISVLSYRLATGTPAEDESFTRSLMKIVDSLFPAKPSVSPSSDKIEFSSEDLSSSSE